MAKLSLWIPAALAVATGCSDDNSPASANTGASSSTTSPSASNAPSGAASTASNPTASSSASNPAASSTGPDASTDPGPAPSDSDSPPDAATPPGDSSSPAPGTPDASSDASPPANACPTAPPFDETDPYILANCVKRIYIEGGDDSRVTFSTDEGATWETVRLDDTDGDDFVNYILVANGIVAVTGKFGVFTDVGNGFELVESISRASFDSYSGQFAASPDEIMLLNQGGTYSTSNGAAWTALDPFPDDSLPAGLAGHFHGAAYGNGNFVFFQDSVFRQFDGATWTEADIPNATFGVAYGNGIFVTAGYGRTRTSVNGLDWSMPTTQDNTATDLRELSGGVVFDGTQFVAFSREPGGYRSDDGETWVPFTSQTSVSYAAFGAGRFFAEFNGKLYGSDDGAAWEEMHTLAQGETQLINGSRVAVGWVLK